MKIAVVSCLLLTLGSAIAQPSRFPTCYGTNLGNRPPVTSESTRQPDGPLDLAASLQVAGPFRGTPAEIRMIRRGMYSEWIGGFINDGQAWWTGVDLERGELLIVRRTVWDRRARMSRLFEFPSNRQPDRSTVVRTWTAEDGGRKEMEEVKRFRLQDRELFVLVCAVNTDLSAPPTSGGYRTDTISSTLKVVDADSNALSISTDGMTDYVMSTIVQRYTAPRK